MRLKKIASYSPTFILATAIVILWELYVRYAQISNEILPGPSLIFQAFVINWSILLQHTIQTLIETMIGIVVAILFGVGTAILLDSSNFLRKTLYPFLITSQTVPMIALAPLLLIWLGFGLLPKVIIVTLYCFFPITIAMADGLSNTDRELLILLKSMNCSYWQTLKMVKLPDSLPSFFSGLKIAVTYSMTGAMVGEYVGAFQGLGIFIQTSANAHEIPLVFAAILITTAVSMILFGFVSFIEKLIVTWN